MAQRALPASKLRARRRQRRIILAIVAGVFCVLLIVGAFALLWLPQVRIHTVAVQGAVSLNAQEVTDVVENDLHGTRHLVIPANSAFFYPHDTIVAHLRDTFTSIQSVSVTRASLTALNVAIVERTAKALWCGESFASSSPCYLLDDSGVVYAPAASFSGDAYVSYYGPTSSSTIKQFVMPEQFRAMTALVAAFAQSGKAGAPARVVASEGEVHLTFDNGFVIKYALADNGADVLERFSQALQADPFTKHPVTDFEYLDLRFGDKLYYKLKASK